jgi:L-alanine-DL-glutamate epimerase-like enolase superfamily enzyme
VEDSPLRHELTHEKVQAEEGWIQVPDRPGLGVTLNEDFIKSTLVEQSS